MQYGIGIDASLGLSFDEQGELVRAAVARGFSSAWTPSGPATRDGFHVCASWAREAGGVADGAFRFGISVIPVPLWTVSSLVNQAGSLASLSEERFILGVGTGGIYSSEYRDTYGLPDWPAVAMMRDYLVTLRALLAGETVTYRGRVVTLRGLQATAQPIRVPLYLAALGPQMLRLAGELADGVALNWATPDQRRWCRDRIAEGSRRAGRASGQVTVMEYIRVCVDEDEDRARRAFARAIMGYALSRPGAPRDRGYRGHFARMGFDDVLARIEAQRDAGATAAELADAFPPEFLRQMGYFGKSAGAASALHDLSRELDVAVVRLVSARPGLGPAMAAMEACRPR